MRKQKIYYHVIENGGYGRIGHQGCYNTIKEAEERVASLSDFFPHCEFYIETTNSKKEPNFITI